MDIISFLLLVIAGLLVYIIVLNLRQPAPPPPSVVVVPPAPVATPRYGVRVLAAMLIIGALALAAYLELLPVF
ncbi:MAG: hypothetical protein IPK16_27425 [Anaerolineales bacterium]|nr:hypothetical protein [Anaerolineales bacterium]